MDHALNYSYIPQRKMQGGDGLYNRMSSTHLFREAQDAEFEYKTKKVAEKLSESMNIVANEPSLAFFRVQEHVRKSLPQLVEQKREVQDLQQQVQGTSFDTEYATNAVKSLHQSSIHFQNIQDLLKNAMFMKQQIDYQRDKVKPSMYKPPNKEGVPSGGRNTPLETNTNEGNQTAASQPEVVQPSSRYGSINS